MTVSEWAVLPADENGEPQTVFRELAEQKSDEREESSSDKGNGERDDCANELERHLAADALARGVLRCLR